MKVLTAALLVFSTMLTVENLSLERRISSLEIEILRTKQDMITYMQKTNGFMNSTNNIIEYHNSTLKSLIGKP